MNKFLTEENSVLPVLKNGQFYEEATIYISEDAHLNFHNSMPQEELSELSFHRPCATVTQFIFSTIY